MTKFFVSVVFFAAVPLFGCSPSTHPGTIATSAPAASTVSAVPPAPTFATAVPAGVDIACEHAEFNAQQFTGDWTEPGKMTLTTLSGDGTLKSNAQSGSWSFMPWLKTPGKSSMPAGEDSHCVLWLHYQSPPPRMDLVYVPLRATVDSLDLSYVGRGNTLHWVRPKASDGSAL